MIKKFVLIFSLIILCGCATVYNPATGRNEFILINTKSEVALGNSLSLQIAKEFKISDDFRLASRLKTVGEKIAKASDRQDLEYRFSVVDDKELNAFAIPGGRVYVNSGILNIANDDEIAAVVAHEVGHIAARHSVKKLQAVLGYQILMSIAFSQASNVNMSQAMDAVFNVISLGYSRNDERLADKLAIKYTHKAGFNPRGMVTFLYKLEGEAKKQGRNYHLIFLSSHPPLDERINNMNKEIHDLEHPDEIKTNAKKPEQKSQLQPVNSDGRLTGNFDAKQEFSNLSKTRKICPVCKNVYSAKYNFCPNDGARLIS